MLRSLIAFCLSRRLLVLVAFAAFLGLGYAAFLTLNIEAYPDPAPPIIEIIAQQPGQSPEEVERYVTIPIEIAVASTPGLKFIRSNTVYALGFIRLQFEYGRDYHFVRQQTLNRLKDAVLPAGVQPVISPAGGISEIFRYELRGPPGMDVMQLKTLQDWVVERKLRIVPGVADVAVLGGKTKEFQAEIDLNRMMAYGLTLPQIMTAISASNSNVGGRTIAIGEQSVNVRGIGVITSLDDIGNIVLTQQGGVPVLLSDVAKVQIGFTPRLGIAGRDDKTDVVTGIVLMQKLERTMDVVKRVRAAVERINTDGIAAARRQDRAVLRSRRPRRDHGADRAAQSAVRHRADLPDPVGVSRRSALRADRRGDDSGGAVPGGDDHGAAGRVRQPAVGRRHRSRHHRRRHRHHGGKHLPPSRPSFARGCRRIAVRRCSDKLSRILTGAVEVDKAIFFSVIITIAAFLPLFTMQGVEGQIFGPMARTYAYALIGAVIATFTVTPVLASILLPAHVQEVETFVVRHIRTRLPGGSGARGPQLSPRGGRSRRCFCCCVSVSGLRLGTEFLPKLEEGNLWIRAVMPPTITLEAGMDTVAQHPHHHLELSAGPDRVFRAGPRR